MNEIKRDEELEKKKLWEAFDDLARDLKEFYLSPKSKNSLVTNEAFTGYYAIREKHIGIIRKYVENWDRIKISRNIDARCKCDMCKRFMRHNPTAKSPAKRAESPHANICVDCMGVSKWADKETK